MVRIAWAGAFFAPAAVIAQPSPIFVKANAAGLNNGGSWTDAYTRLRDALAVADPGEQIWVAEGTYKPTNKRCGSAADCGGAPNSCPAGVCVWSQPREQTFHLLTGVAIYGGFVGDETTLGQRVSPFAHPTILSGDVNGDDGPGLYEDNDENSYHIVTGSGVTATAILDGFTIYGGNAGGPPGPSSYGGGMYSISGTPTIRTCSFDRNVAKFRGGAVANDGGSPIFRDCTFSLNDVSSGGGLGGAIYNGGSGTLAVVHSLFIQNGVNGSGGAIHTEGSATTNVVRTYFANNGALRGGAVSATGSSATNLFDCDFWTNSASIDGGTIWHSSSGVTTLRNCTLGENTASGGFGGGIYLADGMVDVKNSILWGNSDSGGMDSSAQIEVGGGTACVEYSIIQGGWSGCGGNGVLDADPLYFAPFNHFLLRNSPAVDAGDNSAVPLDAYDLDNDGDTIERLPLDTYNRERFVDNPLVSDTGLSAPGYPNIVDIGAYEVPLILYWYVDKDATGTNQGYSWAHAFTTLQNGLAATGTAVNEEIWVAEGTYKPTDKRCGTAADCGGAPNSCSGGDCVWNAPREQTFQLRDGVTIYGGFAGFENDLSERAIVANPTILSGDVTGKDMLVPCGQDSPDCDSFGGRCDNGDCIIPAGNGENSHRVVTGSGTDATAILDGFTITGGNSEAGNAQGGGYFSQGGSATLRSCRIRGNRALGQGGGVSLNTGGGNTTFDNCTIENNWAVAGASGGGLFVFDADCTVRDSIFRSNVSGAGGGAYLQFGTFNFLNTTFIDNRSQSGGAIRMDFTCVAALVNCGFLGNRAPLAGGVLDASTDGTRSFVNSRFVGNASEGSNGGGLYVFSGTNETVHVANCTFHGNTALELGGGIMFQSQAEATIENCIAWGNTDMNGMGASAQISASETTGAPLVNHSLVQDGWTGAGSNNINANPLFVDADGADNILGNEDDNVRLQSGSPAIDAGDSCAVPLDTSDLDGDADTAERLPYDLDENSRMAGYAVDMGAYENQLAVGGDCNRNGQVDDLDVCSGASNDVNADGVPDECAQFDGGCGGNNAWSCANNWENNIVPHNESETYVVVLETPANDVCLDIDVILDALVIADGASLDISGQGGCDGNLEIVESGGLFLDGSLTDTGPCVAGGASARGGHTPPNLTIRGPGATSIVYSTTFEGTVNLLVDSSVPMSLGGDFNNNCVSGLCFNMRDGALLLTGNSPAGPEQRIEAAATDMGPVGTIEGADYAIGTLEIAAGAEVTFNDTFDNDGNGQGACTEAVYVSTLRVGAPATITLDNVRVYYETLDPDPLDPGVIVNTIGCGALVPVTCPTVSAATRFDPTIDRNRYLSIMPGNAGQSVGLRVSVLSSPSVPSITNEVRWVGMPVAVNDPPNGGNIFVAPLQCDPLFMNWAAFPTINVYGPDIVPSTLPPTQYEVVVVPQSCSAFSGAYSAPLLITQAKWGDVRDPFGGASQPNFADINAIVQKFSNLATAPTLTRVDLVGTGNPGQPSTPNRTVSFADVSACVSAFGGFAYPYIGTSCP